jgi:ribose 5-phosphate isomerase B
MKIAIGSDHAGYELKEYLLRELKDQYEFVDLGTNSSASVDYPDYALKVGQMVVQKNADFGILLCGTGIGMSVAANKVEGVRAALAFDLYTAMQSRRHVDANVLVLGGLVTGKGLAVEIVKAWLQTSFESGDRHTRRIDKIRRLEK